MKRYLPILLLLILAACSSSPDSLNSSKSGKKTDMTTLTPFCYQGKSMAVNMPFTEFMQFFPKMSPMPGVQPKPGSPAMTYLSTGADTRVNGMPLKATIQSEFDDQDKLKQFSLKYICSCDPEKVTEEEIINKILEESSNCIDFHKKSHGTRAHFEKYYVQPKGEKGWILTFDIGRKEWE